MFAPPDPRARVIWYEDSGRPGITLVNWRSPQRLGLHPRFVVPSNSGRVDVYGEKARTEAGQVARLLAWKFDGKDY